jgi:hypothetical protein
LHLQPHQNIKLDTTTVIKNENKPVFSSLNPASVMSVFIPAPDGPTPVPIPPSTPVGVAVYGVVVVDGVAVEGVVLVGVVVTGVVGVVPTGVGVVPTGVGVVPTGVGVVPVPAALDKKKVSR